MTRNGSVMSFVVRYLNQIQGKVGSSARITRHHMTSHDSLHELKLPIGRDEADTPLRLKLAQLHTLRDGREQSVTAPYHYSPIPTSASTDVPYPHQPALTSHTHVSQH